MVSKDKVKSGIKKALCTIGAVAIINQVIGAAVFSIVPSINFSTIKTNERAIITRMVIPENFEPIDYLNLASSIVHNNSYGEGVCRDYAIETYHVYDELSALSGRAEYTDDLRLSTGFSGIYGHMWLEVKKDGEFIPYESTLYTPNLKQSDVKDYSEKTLEEKVEINDNYNSIELKKTNSIPGTMINYPTIGSFLYPGGFFRLLYDLTSNGIMLL
ncbi:MAG: hypothetical protein NTV63_03740 [Candidatus Woesearchaeota archaeon]|nr:hypothetical protein [Candidatus Woesearchaeota archaeon]